MKKYCVILNHHKDTTLIQSIFKKKKYDLFYKNCVVGYILINHKIFDVSNHLFDKKYNNFYRSVKEDWFRNFYTKKDFLNIKNFLSLGNVFKDYVARDMVVDMRNFYYCSKLLKKYKYLYISSSESESLKRVSKLFKNRIIIYKSSNYYSHYFCRDRDTQFNKSILVVHPLSFLARCLQFFFLFLLKKKILIYPNSFYQNIFKDSRYLHLNSLNIFKGYYYKENYKEVKNFKLNKNITKEIQKNLILLSKKFSINSNSFFLNYTNHIEKKINTNYKFVNYIYSLNNFVMKKYKPRKIILSGMQDPKNIISIYCAINNKVKKEIMVDGSYMNTFHQVPYCEKKKRPLIDLVYVHSKKELNFFKKNDKFVKIIKKIFPLFKNNNVKKQVNTYDIIILDYSWNYNRFSMNGKKDYSFKIIDDLLSSIKSPNIRKIGIKMKLDSNDEGLEYNNFLMDNIFTKYTDYKIDILTGKLSNYLNSSETFIGGMTTAILEVKKAKKNYIIYKPKELGFDEDFTTKYSVFFNEKNIIRDKKNLLTIIDKIKKKKYIDNLNIN
jgi:hypothetical protein